MKILFYNELEGSTVTAVSGSLNYPPSSIYHEFLRKKFKSMATTDTLTIDLEAAVDMNCLFIGFHNIGSGTASFFDGSLSPVGSSIDLAAADDIFVSHFATISVKRITISATSTGSMLYIGGVGAGMSTTMPTERALPMPYSMGIVEKTTVTETTGGQVSRNRGASLRERVLRWDHVAKATKDVIEAKVLLTGVGKPIFIDLFENDRDFDPPIYAQIVTERSVMFEDPGDYMIELKVREAR